MVSVPYGVLLSKCIKLQWNSELRERGSVPSRGLSYLNQEVSTAGFCSAISFRPLTGTLLSKQIGIRLLPMFSTYISVPSRGLSYLNF